MVKHKKRNREMVAKAAEAIGCNKMTMLGLLTLSQLTYDSCEVPYHLRCVVTDPLRFKSDLDLEIRR